jgi:hypothetical protein
MKNTIQDKKPNFRDSNGNLFIVRCFYCDPNHGTENNAAYVASGTCAWCGFCEQNNLLYIKNKVDKE